MTVKPDSVVRSRQDPAPVVGPVTIKPDSVVRSRQDGAIGIVKRLHRDLPGDPEQALVRWHDGMMSWHQPDALELVSAPVEALADLSPDEAVMATEIAHNLAMNLKRIREERGFSQRAFAPRIGLSRPYLADIETGRRDMNLRTFLHMCALLEVDPSTLLGLGRTRA
jgi:DNA-binding XRE family transcriptional regulator